MKTKKQQVKQQIVATMVIGFMFLMLAGSFNVSKMLAATTNQTNLIQNLVAGQLQLEAPWNKGFNDITVGQAINSLANLDMVNMRDYRGNGVGWTVTGYANNLSVAATGINNISNAQIFWSPGVVTAFQGSATGVTAGAALQALSASRTLVSATAGNGMGNYRVSNTVLNVVYNGRVDQLAGTYIATLFMSIQ